MKGKAFPSRLLRAPLPHLLKGPASQTHGAGGGATSTIRDEPVCFAPRRHSPGTKRPTLRSGSHRAACRPAPISAFELRRGPEFRWVISNLRGIAPRARHKNRPGRGSLLTSLRPHQPGRFLWPLLPPRFASGSGFHESMKPLAKAMEESIRNWSRAESCLLQPVYPDRPDEIFATLHERRKNHEEDF